MAAQTYLKFNGQERHMILGIGDFHADLPALPVPESIANQYDTEEMKALGWVVTKVEDDHGTRKSKAKSATEPSPENSLTV